MSVNILILVTSLVCQQPDPDGQALNKLNQYRKSAGLTPVVLDPALSRGCREHAQYLARNIEVLSARKAAVNVEDNALPGFTEEGNRTAGSAFTYVNGSPLQTLDWLAATLFARMAMLHPDLKRIGVGHATDKKNRTFTVIDVNRGRGLTQPLFYPVDQQKDVPLGYAFPDLPTPIPEAEAKKAGFPVTVTFPTEVVVKKVTATLKNGDGKELEHWLYTPDKPAGPAPLQRNTVCLIPKEALQALTPHTATVAAEVNGMPWTKTWAFTTGDRLSPRRDVEVEPLDRLNSYRKTAGLAPVVLDPNLSKGCDDHAVYVKINAAYLKAKKIAATDEDPKLPAYSVEGQRAAQRSITDTTDPIVLLDNSMATLFRRLGVLDPEVRRIGIGVTKGGAPGHVTVIDLGSGRSGNQLVLFPPDKEKDVPLQFGIESPDPVPMSKDKKVGFPITVHFAEGVPVKVLSAKLVDDTKKEVAVWLSTPESPAVHAILQRSVVALIPKAPLKPLTTYRVSIEAQIGDDKVTKAWTFITAKK